MTVLFFAMLCACGAQGELVDMKTVENDEYLAIVWEGRTYVPFTAVSPKDYGRQIGYLNGDWNDRVCEYKRHREEEWIVNYLTVDEGAVQRTERDRSSSGFGIGIPLE